jgi:uncharacterized membrane protein YqjE
MAASDCSISEILQDVLRNLQEIIRSEVRLAKTEVREEITKAKAAGLLVGAGAVCGILGVFFLCLAIVYALALVVPNWGAALIVTAILFTLAAIAVIAGLNQFKRVKPVPDKTVGSMKESVEWAKQQTK